MLKRIGILLTLCLILAGCGSKSSYDQVTRFHDSGKAKPVVAFVPVFDRSSADVGWSLAEEFTDQMRTRFLKRNSLYLNLQSGLNETIISMSAHNNPFSENTEWIKEAFDTQEFVIFTELVEHDIHAKTPKGNFVDKITPSSEIAMTMRVRVFDLRGESPEVVLQELIHQSHLIPKPNNINEPSPGKWKKVTFTVSPLGLAHAQLSKEAVKRIEDYILIAKAR